MPETTLIGAQPKIAASSPSMNAVQHSIERLALEITPAAMSPRP
jgi:hypothetical protein